MDALRPRDPRPRDSDYMGWIAGLRCVACAVGFVFRRGVHVAHVRYADAEAGWRETGMQEKPSDRRTLPLCPAHHVNGPNAQHKMGERRFWEELNINPPDLCLALADAYEAGLDGDLIIARFAGAARREMPWKS